MWSVSRVKSYRELLTSGAGECQSLVSVLSAAQQGFDFADLRYNAGKSTTAERLDAHEALVKPQATVAQAKADEIDRLR